MRRVELVPLEVAGAMLVFTASFMITSGMQIMLSRALESRTIYVISISTLLALSKNIFPKYFATSPQSAVASPTAISPSGSRPPSASPYCSGLAFGGPPGLLGRTPAARRPMLPRP
jgi:hypothetical protein